MPDHSPQVYIVPQCSTSRAPARRGALVVP